MYSRGRRGAPAKGVGRDNRRESSNLSFSAKKTRQTMCLSCFFALKSVEFELEAPGTGKGEQEKTIEYRFFEAKEPKRE